MVSTFTHFKISQTENQSNSNQQFSLNSYQKDHSMIYFKRSKRSLTDHEWTTTKKQMCLIGIADAMRYMHKHGILQHDLKPENILFDQNNLTRVCDFGLSRCFNDDIKMTNNIGTPLYMAPELLDDYNRY